MIKIRNIKKVLIVTYYWPPSGGIGIVRWLKFSKYLKQFGWEPIIYTAKDADYPSIDKNTLKDVPPDIQIIRHQIQEPYAIYKRILNKSKDEKINNVFYTGNQKQSFSKWISLWIRSNMFIPDARALWIRPSVKFLTNYIQSNHIDAIISTGPPHTTTRIATLVKKKTNIPWLADFRDPWTQIDYYKELILTKWANRRHHKLEQQAFAAADKIVIVSNSWKSDLESIGATNVEVVPTGFDSDDYIDLPRVSSTKFIISHFGIMGKDRNPKILFKAISQLLIEEHKLKNNLQIRLGGQIDHTVRKTITEFGLDNYINYVGTVPRDTAINHMAESSILLLLLNKQGNAKGRIPGKVFEYLGVKRPILCLGEQYGDASEIVEQTKSGQHCNYNDLNKIKNFIKKQYNLYQSNESNVINTEISEYSCNASCGKIASYLNEITT